MQGVLDSFLQDMIAKPWDDGSGLYCANMIVPWVKRVAGLDMGKGIRAASDADAARIVEEAGDLLSLISYHAEIVGLDETDDPSAGDIAVVEVMQPGGGTTQACALICREGRAAIKTHGVLRIRPDRYRILAAWCVPAFEA